MGIRGTEREEGGRKARVSRMGERERERKGERER